MTDERGDSVCFDSGSHHVVDGREFPWIPGATVVQGRLLVVDGARIKVHGELRVVALGAQGKRQPKIEAKGAEVTAIEGAPFVRLLMGARGKLHQNATFEALDNAQVHLHDDVSGQASDDSVIFFTPTSRGEVLVTDLRVRLVAPHGFGYQMRDTERGIVATLAR